MRRVTIRDAAPSDFGSVCTLNLPEVQHTSPMDAARLLTLANVACYFKIAEVNASVAAFLLAMCDGAPYQNDNFAWFARRYPRFLYVDRIVVSAAVRGRRVGSVLYDDLFRYARDHAIPVVTCEYNIVPPNEPSRRFHDKFGFTQQGTQWVADGTKHVSLQVAKA